MCWGLALFAFLVRFPLLQWGLPQPEEEALPVHKAFEMWGWDEGRPDLDPKTAGWPALSFYVNFALQQAQYGFGKLTGRYDDPLDFYVEHVDVSTLRVPSRFLNLLAGVAVVVIGARLARRLVGTFGGLITGLALALSPLLIAYSVNVAPDGLLALFSALAITRLVDVAQKGRMRDFVWSGVWIGLGAASKYTPVLLVPCLVGASLAGPGRAAGIAGLLDRRLLAGFLACAATFFAASPYTILNAAVAQRDISSQIFRVATEGHFGHELQSNGFVFYVREALPAALGWPAFVLGSAGLALAAWRRRGAWLVIALSFACYFIGLGALRSSFPHYMLPAVLPVALGLAALAGEFGRFPGAARFLPAAAGTIGLLALVVVPLASAAARQHVRYSRPSTNNEARNLILQELARPEAYFACEIGGPELPRSPAAEFASRGVFRRLSEDQRAKLLSRPFVNRFVIYMYMIGAEGADVYYDLRHYRHYDYVVVSGKAHDRYVALKETYPRQNTFYDDLKQHTELVRHVRAAPDRLGPDVWIYRIGPQTRSSLDERPALAPGFQNALTDKVRRADFQAFLGFTGAVAMQREDWRGADLYLGTLLEVSPERRESMLIPIARVKSMAGDFAGASRLCAEYLQRRPDDAEALALSAAIAERGAGAIRPRGSDDVR